MSEEAGVVELVPEPGQVDPDDFQSKVALKPPPASIAKERVNQIYNDAVKNINFETFTTDDGFELAGRLVELFMDLDDLTGEEKRDLTTYIIHRLYNEIPDNNNEKRAIWNSLIKSGLTRLINFSYKQIMRVFDLNNDGRISCNECRKVCCPTAPALQYTPSSEEMER
jgi:hypothetical protein